MPFGLAGQISPSYNLHNLDKLGFNPAFAGSRGALCATAQYRNQWVGFDDAPKNYSVSVHAPIHNERMGLGLLAEKNSAGIYRETNLMANYVYNIELVEGKLAFGLGFGATFYNAAWNELVPSHPNDMLLLNDPESMVLPNFSIGTYYYTRNYFIGFSMPFLVSRELDEADGQYYGSFNLASDNYYFTGGYAFQINPIMKLSPSVLLKMHPGNSAQVDFNLQVSLKDKIALGLGYRNDNSLIGILEIQLNQQFRMAYAYDFDLSPLGRYKGGSHEIGISYIFSFERNVMNPRQF